MIRPDSLTGLAAALLTPAIGLALFVTPPADLRPSFGRSLAFDAASAHRHEEQLKVCDAFYEASGTLSKAQRDSLASICAPFEERMGYYAVEGVGCSWYCGGGLDSQSATSTLPRPRSFDYAAGNAHDLDLSTAWVEGVAGDGIGQSLTYHFPPTNPRVTEIIVANGYVRTADLYRRNGRARTLIVYHNDTPFARLHLADTLAAQRFTLPAPIGYGDRSDFKTLAAKPPWTLRFEIAAVYPGTTHDDTAVSEIWFDGIDVH